MAPASDFGQIGLAGSVKRWREVLRSVMVPTTTTAISMWTHQTQCACRYALKATVAHKDPVNGPVWGHAADAKFAGGSQYYSA